MKSFVAVKKISFGLIYTALISVVLITALYTIDSIRYSADTATAELPLVVGLQPSSNQVTAGDGSSIEVNSMVIRNSSSVPALDHVSIFATKAGATFSPDNDDAGKESICSAANGGSNHLLNLIGITRCPNGNTCNPVNWNAPSDPGYHQLFAVAMGTASAGCTVGNILGWSVSNDSLMVNVTSSTSSATQNITISATSPAILDQDIPVRIQTKPSTSINHISLFATENNGPGASTIDNAYVCTQANKSDQNDSTLKLLHIQTCDKADPNDPWETSCDASIPIRFSQTGTHRLVAVAISNTNECSASGTDANVVEINKSVVVSVVSPADPGGTNTSSGIGSGNGAGGNGGGGNGGNGGGGNGTGGVTAGSINFKNTTNVTSITDLLVKYGTWVGLLLGAIVFGSFIYAGFNYITSNGDDKALQRAKKAMTWSIVGMVVFILAAFLVRYASATLSSFNIMSTDLKALFHLQ